MYGYKRQVNLPYAAAVEKVKADLRNEKLAPLARQVEQKLQDAIGRV